MPDILGAFSGTPTSYHRPLVRYSYTQDIVGNYSDVTATLVFVRYRTDSWGYNYSTHSNTGNIDGSTDYSGDTDFDTRPYVGEYSLRSITRRIYHNADGTKQIYIGWSGNTNISWGTYNFGETVTLATIPREAYITNQPNFTVNTTSNTNIGLTFWNNGNLWIRVQLYISGTLIKTQDFGQVTSGTFVLGSSENGTVYSKMPNSTSVGGYFRVKTYTSGSYSTQVGSDKDKSITASANTSLILPIFTTCSLKNIDKEIEVRDKYDNLLVTSSTADLLGTDTKAIIGYSKVSGYIAVANKAQAQYSATMVKYRLSLGAQSAEANYSANDDVNIYIDNLQVNSGTMSAIDSRSLLTNINVSIEAVNYESVTLYDLKTWRENGIGETVTLSFSGTFWNESFGNVSNTIVCEYRYKESSEEWDQQEWIEAEVEINGNNFSFSGEIDDEFDPELQYDVEVRVYDLLSNRIEDVIINKGTPVMDFNKNGVAIKGKYDETIGGALQIENEFWLEKVYPVGSIYISTVDTNPADLFGFGTWEAFGAGRVLVGYNGSDSDFNASEKTGGAKTHTLTTNEIPSHSHYNNPGYAGAVLKWDGSTTYGHKPSEAAYGSTAAVAVSTWFKDTGGGQAHNNLQPYIVVYMWKRTA